MPGPTTPHTETGQNQGFEASDFEGRASSKTPARGEDALGAGNEGAQTATNRGNAHAPNARHGSHPVESLTEDEAGRREPADPGAQGISNRAAGEEANPTYGVKTEHAPHVQSAIDELRKEDRTG